MQTTPAQPVGQILRLRRHRRRLSQLELALDAEISPRHLSFLETGRATPSRATLLRLARQLQIPLREQNALLLASGYAPVFAEQPLAAPAMSLARRTVGLVLTGHEPAPAIAAQDRQGDQRGAGRQPRALARRSPSYCQPS